MRERVIVAWLLDHERHAKLCVVPAIMETNCVILRHVENVPGACTAARTAGEYFERVLLV